MQHAAQSPETAIDLRDQLSAAQQKIERQKSYIDQLEEFIRNLRQKQFGASSEVQDPLQVSLFDEGEEEGEEEGVDGTEAATVTVAVQVLALPHGSVTVSVTSLAPRLAQVNDVLLKV